MTTNNSIAQRIKTFADQIHALTGWTLIPEVVDRGVLFDCDQGSVFYPWTAIAEDQMDAIGVARSIVSAQEKCSCVSSTY